MALLDGIQLPDGPTGTAVRLYLEAQDRKDLGNAAEFFHDDIVFNGLLLKAEGRDTVAAAVGQFLEQAIESIRIEAITQVEAGDICRVLALYWFKLRPAPEFQILCDHLTIRGGRITRVDNVFDASKLPPM
ncbi:MAG: nuclear transport factor 2 family protein [Deltaproteobacteria bacterium]|nr:nuclear transport factor 2 family protein [Deltaproteobacteria bacterium]